jgi:3-oxoacyl-[acyl-carrier protein] reductase
VLQLNYLCRFFGMKPNIKNQVVLITGATGGIGEAIARAFHAEGARLAISGRKLEKLEALQRELPGTLVLPCDLSDLSAAKNLIALVIAHFGRIDILINNAASIIVSPALTVNSDDMKHAFDTNVVAPLLCIQASFEQMRIQGGGIIINIGSPGFMLGIPFYSPYVCSKGAFSALTRTLQAENDCRGIHICEYFPGYVETPNKAESRIGDVAQDFLMNEKQNVFTKPQKAETIARHILALARKPRPLRYSAISVKMGAFFALFPSFRIRLSRKMAQTARSKMKLLNHKNTL